MSRTFNAKEILALAAAGKMSIKELREAVATARDFGSQDAALALQATLEQRTGLRLKPTAKENSLTSAWLASGVKSVRNIQYSWSAIAEDGVPVFTVWEPYLPGKQLLLWTPTRLPYEGKKGYTDRKQHALVGLSKGGKSRAFEIRGLKMDWGAKSKIEYASTEPFEARVQRRGEELWLVWQ